MSIPQQSLPRIRLRGNASPSIPYKPGRHLSVNKARPHLTGNQFAHNARVVKLAFTNALSKRSRGDAMKALEEVAGKIIKLAMKGHIPAAKEMFDRLDGRPAQMIIGDPNQPITFKNVTEMTDSELEQIARGVTIDGESRRDGA